MYLTRQRRMRHNRWVGPAPSLLGWAPRWPGYYRAEAPPLRRRRCLRGLWGDEGSQPGQLVRSGTVWRWGPLKGLRRKSSHRNTCGPDRSPETSLHKLSVGLRLEMPSPMHSILCELHQATTARLGAKETRLSSRHDRLVSCDRPSM